MALYKKNRNLVILFVLLLLASNICEAYTGGHYSGVNLIKGPSHTVYRTLGSDAFFEWSFNFDKERLKLKDFQPSFVFGLWDENIGYIHQKLSVQPTTIIRLKNDEYYNKIKWEGNISNCQYDDCYGKITLHNLTKHDFKSYGINIFAGKSVPPRQHVFKLVIGESAKIVTWKQKENSTILECEATGRPNPQVQIHKQNKILANGTGKVTFQVKESGEYYCTAQSLEIDSEPIKHPKKLSIIKQEQPKQEPSSTTLKEETDKTADNETYRSTATTSSSVISTVVTLFVVRDFFTVI